MERETFSNELGGVHEHGDRHDSFSNEFQGVPAAPGHKHDSFSDEFRGVPDKSFRDERPSGMFDSGRKGRRMLWVIVLSLAVLGGGGWALWYWSEPIGSFIAGLGRDAEPEVEAEPELEAEPEAAPAPAPASEPEVEKVFGIKGTPDGADAGPLPTPMPDPDPTPTSPTPPPLPAAPSVETLTTQVRGKVASAGVDTRLAVVDTALRECWAKAADSVGAVELELSFSIKWNGKAQSARASGASEALHACVEDALPSGGWPQPRDGGEATVTRRWRLD